jgi:hypothetical protein
MEHPKTKLLDKIFDDKKQKVSAYATWFNFYWTINIAILTVFKAQTNNVEIIVLFMFLTVGAFTSVVGMFFYVKSRNSTINKLSIEIYKDNRNIYVSWFEYLIGSIFGLSFLILLGFWVYLFFQLNII